MKNILFRESIFSPSYQVSGLFLTISISFKDKQKENKLILYMCSLERSKFIWWRLGNCRMVKTICELPLWNRNCLQHKHCQTIHCPILFSSQPLLLHTNRLTLVTMNANCFSNLIENNILWNNIRSEFFKSSKNIF